MQVFMTALTIITLTTGLSVHSADVDTSRSTAVQVPVSISGGASSAGVIG